MIAPDGSITDPLICPVGAWAQRAEDKVMATAINLDFIFSPGYKAIDNLSQFVDGMKGGLGQAVSCPSDSMERYASLGGTLAVVLRRAPPHMAVPQKPIRFRSKKPHYLLVNFPSQPW